MSNWRPSFEANHFTYSSTARSAAFSRNSNVPTFVPREMLNTTTARRKAMHKPKPRSPPRNRPAFSSKSPLPAISADEATLARDSELLDVIKEMRTQLAQQQNQLDAMLREVGETDSLRAEVADLRAQLANHAAVSCENDENLSLGPELSLRGAPVSKAQQLRRGESRFRVQHSEEGAADRYTLGDILGQGGYGTVYRAQPALGTGGPVT